MFHKEESNFLTNVIIMELCGKSLHDVLILPENSFGLEEEYFKRVVFDISKNKYFPLFNTIIELECETFNTALYSFSCQT